MREWWKDWLIQATAGVAATLVALAIAALAGKVTHLFDNASFEANRFAVITVLVPLVTLVLFLLTLAVGQAVGVDTLKALFGSENWMGAMRRLAPSSPS